MPFAAGRPYRLRAPLTRSCEATVGNMFKRGFRFLLFLVLFLGPAFWLLGPLSWSSSWSGFLDCSAAAMASAADHLQRLGRLGELPQRSLRMQLDPVSVLGSSSQNRRFALGPTPLRLYKPSAESAAPDSVLPPAPNSLLFVGMIFVVGCLWACASNMLVLFGCCSRNRAAALASVVPSPSEGAPSGPPQRDASTEVLDAL